MIKVEIKSGEEIIKKLTQIIKTKNIRSGSISLIGAVDSCSISTMPKNNAKNDIFAAYHEPLELSGTGEIIDGKPHVHVVLGREDKTAIFGHLHWGKVEEWFVNIYIMPLKED